MTREFAVVGGGNMARAIVAGAIASGRFSADAFTIADPNHAAHGAFADIGVRAVAHAGELREPLERGAALVLAVKPQILTAAANDLPRVGRRVLVVSILAGATIGALTEALAGPLGGAPAIVRVMPNTPVQVREGMSALAIGPGVRTGEADLIDELFQSVGRTERLDESLIDAFTAVVGSGPAYVFLLAESLERGGAALGLPGGSLRAMVAQLLVGSSRLLADRAPEDPAELRRAVTSKGGSTAAALTVLEDAGFDRLVADALEAARDRNLQLAREATS